MTYDILCQLNVMFWWRFSGMRTTQLTWTTTIWKGDILLGPCYLRLSWRSTALWGKTQSMRLEAELGIYLRSNSFLSHNALASGTYLFWLTSKTTSPNFTHNAKYKNICLTLQNKFGLESWYLPWTWILTSFDVLLTLRSSTWQILTEIHRCQVSDVKPWMWRPIEATSGELGLTFQQILKQKMPNGNFQGFFRIFRKMNHFNHLFHFRWDPTMNHFDDLSLGEQHFRVIDGLKNEGAWSGWEILWMIWWCQSIYACLQRWF